TVDVKLELTHDGRLTAVISADRSDTLMMLQRGSGELQQALRDAGVQADSGSLSFNLRGDGQSGGQNYSGAGQSGFTQVAQTSAGSLAADLPPAPIAANVLATTATGRLNIQV
ncbi:MAG TPA: flagellar hook-length control protein FliK, partial [Stellaceae bacterium]|nr:flagellar hook-length control protein FliK [Stellaceae bacterium]